jgi:hypothetical protein
MDALLPLLWVYSIIFECIHCIYQAFAEIKSHDSAAIGNVGSNWKKWKVQKLSHITTQRNIQRVSFVQLLVKCSVGPYDAHWCCVSRGELMVLIVANSKMAASIFRHGGFLFWPFKRRVRCLPWFVCLLGVLNIESLFARFADRVFNKGLLYLLTCSSTGSSGYSSRCHSYETLQCILVETFIKSSRMPTYLSCIYMHDFNVLLTLCYSAIFERTDYAFYAQHCKQMTINLTVFCWQSSCQFFTVKLNCENP